MIVFLVYLYSIASTTMHSVTVYLDYESDRFLWNKTGKMDIGALKQWTRLNGGEDFCC